jgi:protoheme IX farnesyltransferase
MLGSGLLLFRVNVMALCLGLLALIWYNLIYTNLKRITPHAVIPGSVIGSIPPLVGWVAAGGSLTDTRAWVIALFFFVWQVPHFYLLVLKYGPQYEAAGMPALTSRHSNRIIRLMIFLWIVTTAISALLFGYFNVTRSVITMLAMGIASIWLMIVFIMPVLDPGSDFYPFRYFMKINYYVLFIIVILNLDHVMVKLLF